MGLPKGTTNNPAGRPKGKPNKTTQELRNLFQCFIETNIESLQNDFDQLEPKERLYFIERLARLVLPALSRTVITNDFEAEKKRVASLFPTQEEFEEMQKNGSG